MLLNCGCQTSVVGLIFLCNFLNCIFPWKQFVIRRPLNGKHIIFLKGHRVTHKPPTAPINKMASFSAAFGVLDSEGGLLLNFKRRFRARVMTVLKDKLQSEWNKISEAPWVWRCRLFGPLVAEWRVPSPLPLWWWWEIQSGNARRTTVASAGYQVWWAFKVPC